MKTFAEFTNESFDRAEFRRHMDSLRAKEELKKTNPMAARVGELVDKEKERLSTTKKKSDISARASHDSDPYSSFNSIYSPNWKP